MTGQEKGHQWYSARDGKQTGPMTDAEINAIARLGYFRDKDLVWRAGFADWQPALMVFPPQPVVLPPPVPVEPPAPAAAARPVAPAPDQVSRQPEMQRPLVEQRPMPAVAEPQRRPAQPATQPDQAPGWPAQDKRDVPVQQQTQPEAQPLWPPFERPVPAPEARISQPSAPVTSPRPMFAPAAAPQAVTPEPLKPLFIPAAESTRLPLNLPRNSEATGRNPNAPPAGPRLRS